MELSQVRVVLVRPRGPTNVGVAARAIANHGLGELVLVAPQCFDPEEARWRGPGARSVIDGMRIVSTVTQAVAGARLVVGATARRRRWDWPVWNANMLADAVIDQHGPAALVFGPEDAGLSNDELEPCTAVLTLRTGVVSSLNLAQAVTVTGHALYSRQAARRADPLPSPRPATADVIHAVMTQASTVLALGGYLRGRSKQQVRSTLVRMLGRLAPTQTEAAILGGMVRHVRWTLTHPDHPDAVALRVAHS
ncbi:MAG: hypothetical protein GXP62_00870, partial [Oligoflexia bacterium]|nr:hypothetical protein [Oligoflexia bacterium]